MEEKELGVVRPLHHGGLVREQSASWREARLHLDRAWSRCGQRARDREPAVEDRSGADYSCAASIHRRGEAEPVCCSAPTSATAILPGFAAAACEVGAGKLPPWRIVWQYLGKHVRDDLGTKAGGQPTNRNNLFEVAQRHQYPPSQPPLRRVRSGVSSRLAVTLCVPQRKPPQPFVCTSGIIAALRITDRRAKSDTPFRLFGTGSVGGQVLTGIPRLESMRFDPEFAECSAVWPFETGWAPASGSWLDPQLRVLHAEIYPSVRERLSDPIKDRGQVRAMWHWARDLDAKNLLIREFATPPGIVNASAVDNVICSEEGWILGCPH